jgi:hypothetical protein
MLLLTEDIRTHCGSVLFSLRKEWARPNARQPARFLGAG